MSTSKDRPWLVRTYSGHSSARTSNELYRSNLAKGQTGLSVAFDLPTQTGYDPDHPLARGEVGKVGVPISHLDDMDVLFDQLPLDQMNTSMTINAVAPWMLALYIALAERRGIDPAKLQGTTQNDIVKEYLSRGTHIFPPGPSLRLIVDTITYSVPNVPKWNPTNICSYHLQEAGATPVQELAYALSTAIMVLDAVRDSGQIPEADFPKVVSRLSFFVNAGIRFIEECCKMRAFTQMWDEITLERYGVKDAKQRRFRYGVQVNSLGLTESQPENNVQRIVLEMLAVVLSKDARARAVQLPAWNEALGLPRPWDQQWSLRIQQVMAFETDLLEYGDILNGSPVIEAKMQELMEGANAEIQRVAEQGGVLAGIDSGYMKQALVKSHAERLRAIETGELTIVGVNKFKETAESPLTQSGDGGIMKVDPAVEQQHIEAIQAHRANRDQDKVNSALNTLRDVAKSNDNIMPASIACAHAGVTTGEWAQTLRDVFGEYRAPTGIDISSSIGGDPERVAALRERVTATGSSLGRPIKLLVAKPGLDGHSNGAEQIAVKARELGMEVVYEGIRLTPQQIVAAAQEEGVHLVGLSVLSGSHTAMAEMVIDGLRAIDLGALPVTMGGIIPEDEHVALKERGIAAIYTPKDSDLNKIMAEMVDLARLAHQLDAFGPL
ncbi:methylmalonyl-CoA mutase family protein [Pseudomonadales bacterium]|nr:methylmalonyl-CoA mutase family protein [Pseudomonadales bacterium]MDB4451140.1 methylmalonyl-CoA mutase family protein [Pseudomonadales bacterium]MDB4452571.1 methylmalonyl-CoA mutase family protein [bacterium]